MIGASTRWAGAAAAAVALAALAWAFAPRPLDVETAKALVGPFESTIDEDGRTRLRDRFVVSAPLTGRLMRIALREGDAVSEGAVVATLMPSLSPLLDERSLAELRARLESARANVERTAARVEGAQVAVALARNDARRSAELAGQGFVAASRQEADRLALQAALKEHEAAQAERRIAGHDLEQASAALSAARRGGGPAFDVRSPVAGRVLRVLQPSEGSVTLGVPLIELGDLERLEIVAELLTTDAMALSPGQPVRIERWGGPSELRGRVRLIEPGGFTKVSALGVEEQRVRVVIDIVSPAGQWRALGDGFRVGVRIIVQSAPNALLVPLAAVFPQASGGAAVFTVDQGRARMQAVEVGARSATHAWVRAGLATGAEVVIYPPPALSDGTRVRPRGVWQPRGTDSE